MQLPPGSLQAWALALIEERSIPAKLSPPTPPEWLAPEVGALRVAAPGRAPELRVLARAEKAPRPGALVEPEARARLLHTFAHHEVQAAELFAWALLAFPETEEDFRAGLVTLIFDELRHARLYCAELERLGWRYGDFPVRDWFWQRFVACRTPLQFLALMGLGVEAGNLDHAELWAQRFEEVGDEAGARAQRQVGREEVAHVRFAARWFERWAGELSFERWRSELPPPLTPLVLRGKELQREARLAAGVDEVFLEEYEAWSAATSGS